MFEARLLWHCCRDIATEAFRIHLGPAQQLVPLIKVAITLRGDDLRNTVHLMFRLS